MADQATSSNGRTTIFFEPTYKGTPSPKNGLIIPFNKNNLGQKQALIKPGTITGRRDASAPGLGRKTVDGPLVLPSCYNTLGYFYKAMFGAPVTTAGSTAGTLTGATGVSTTIGDWNAVTDGAFKISIDASAATEITGLNFSTDTTLALVATRLQAAIRAIATGGFTLATVAWQVGTTNFKITSGTKSATSAVAALTAPTAGTDVATMMKCKSTDTPTIVAGTYAKYIHTFKIVSGTAQPSMKIEKAFTDIGQYFLYDGVKLGKLSTSFGIGDSEHVHTFDFLGSSETLGTSEYDASATAVTLNRLNDFQAIIKEGGSTVSNIATCELAIDLGLDGDQFTIGSGNTRGAIPEGQVGISGKITALFTDTTILAKALAGTESSIEIISTAGNNDAVSYDFNELIYSASSPVIEGPTGVRVELDFMGYYGNDAGNSSAIVTLTNDVESYA